MESERVKRIKDFAVDWWLRLFILPPARHVVVVTVAEWDNTWQGDRYSVYGVFDSKEAALQCRPDWHDITIYRGDDLWMASSGPGGSTYTMREFEVED